MAIDTVMPGDARFERLSHGQNGRFPVKDSDRVGRVALCDNSADVVEALEKFLHAGLRPTVRSGGHCYEDFVDNNPQGAVIDVSMINGTAPTVGGPKYRLGAGALLGRAYQDLYKRGMVTLPGGTCSQVGAGGHIQGAGYGYLSRMYGVTPDWVSAVDIVTADANGKVQVVRADKRNHSDLLRAVRGSGGGNYGIVTDFYFDELPKAPTEVIKGNVSFGWEGMTEERFARILYLYSNYWATRGKDKETWGLFTIFGLTHRTSNRLGLSITYSGMDGTVNDTRVLDEFLAVFDECKPVTELKQHPAMAEHHPSSDAKAVNLCVANHTVRKLDWIDSVTGWPSNLQATTRPRHKYKSTYMRQAFTREEALCFYKHLNRTIPGVDLSHNTVLVDSFGGAVNNPKMLEETVSAQRTSIMKLQFITTWNDPAQDEGQATWLRDFYTDVYGNSAVGARYNGTPYWSDRYEGAYINYPDLDMLQHDYWPQLYWGTKGNWEFMQSVKKRYDPANVFHHAMSVRT